MLNSKFHVSLKGLTGSDITGYSVAMLECETCNAVAGQKCSTTDGKPTCSSRFTAAVRQLSQVAAQAVRDEVMKAEGVTLTKFEPTPQTGTCNCWYCRNNEPHKCFKKPVGEVPRIGPQDPFAGVYRDPSSLGDLVRGSPTRTEGTCAMDEDYFASLLDKGESRQGDAEHLAYVAHLDGMEPPDSYWDNDYVSPHTTDLDLTKFAPVHQALAAQCPGHPITDTGTCTNCDKADVKPEEHRCIDCANGRECMFTPKPEPAMVTVADPWSGEPVTVTREQAKKWTAEGW